MYHHPDCEKYRQWKKQQAAKNEQTKKKRRRRRKRIVDCVEEEKQKAPPTVITRIQYRRCEKKKKSKTKKRNAISLKKQIPLIDLLLKKIQPPLMDRNRVLDARHHPCFSEMATEMDEQPPKELDVLCLEKFPGISRKPKRRKGKRKLKGGTKDSVTDDQADDTRSEKTDDKEKQGESDEKGGRKVRRKKGKFWCEKLRSKKAMPLESDSECSSICSFDSHICLKGLSLTMDDKNPQNALTPAE